MPTVEPIKPGRPGYPTPAPTPAPTDETGNPISDSWIDIPTPDPSDNNEETKEDEQKPEIPTVTPLEEAQEKVVKAAKAIAYLLEVSTDNKFPSLKDSIKHSLRLIFKKKKVSQEKSQYETFLSKKVFDDFLK